MRLFINLAWFIKREWRAYLLGILSLLMVALLGLLPPAMIGKFANLLVERQLSSTAIFEIVGLICSCHHWPVHLSLRVVILYLGHVSPPRKDSPNSIVWPLFTNGCAVFSTLSHW